MIENFFQKMSDKSSRQISIIEKQESINYAMPKIETDRRDAETTTQLLKETTKKSIVKESTIKNIKTPSLGIGEEIIYDGLTYTELTKKLNLNLYSTLDNKGNFIADYTSKTGLDPYLALAIILHETGCKWGCSKLVNECNNVGGIKGQPSCNGSSYKKYETLDIGITSYLDMIFNNYYSKGLTTPELMNPKYASSTAWAKAINKYIETIKNS